MKNLLLAAISLLLLAVVATTLTADRQRQVAGPGPEVAPKEATTTTGTLEARSADRQATLLPAETGTAFFQLPRGRRFTHRFETAQTSTSTFGDPPQTVELATEMEGGLEVLVVETAGDRLVLQLTLTEIELAVTGSQPLTAEQAASAAKAFEITAMVLMQNDGQTLGYRFEEGVATEARNLVRGLWSALHVVAPAAGETEVQVQEADVTGPYLARFLWGAADGAERPVSKARTPQENYDDGVNGNATLGSGTGTLSQTLRWPIEMSYEQSGSLNKPELKLTAEQSARFRFELSEADQIPAGQLPTVDLAAAWAPVSGFEEAVAQSRDRNRRVQHDLAKVGLQDLIGEIQALTAGDQPPTRALYEACRSLAELLRRDPSALLELEELLASGALQGQAALMVLSAVGTVGTEAAQDFLATRIGQDQDAELQAYALQAAVQIATPTPLLVDTVRSTAQSAQPGEELYGRSLLVLGALASRPAGADSIDFLLKEGERAEDVEALILWLAALGNSGSANIVSVVEGYLNHDEAGVRRAAAAALRHVFTAGANDLLRNSSLADASNVVRAEAVGILAQRSVPTADQTVATVLKRDQDAGVRSAAVQGLGRRAPGNEFARASLTEVSLGDPDANVREMAQSLLNG